MVSLTAHRPHIKPLVALLAIVGMLLSGVALYQHVVYSHGLASGPSFCNISQHLNCEAVNTSPWSVFLGLPVASYGLFFYTSLLALMCCCGPNRLVSSHKAYEVVLLLACVASVVSVVLFAVSELVIGALCILCVALYLLNFALMGVAWWGVARGSLVGGILGGVQNLFEYVLLILRGRRAAVVGLVAIGLVGVTAAVSPRIVLKVVQDAGSTMHEQVQKQDWVSQWRNSEEVSVRIEQAPGAFADYSKGVPEAPIQIVEFADIECQGCRATYREMEQILGHYQGLFRLVFKNFPLDNACNPEIPRKFHEHACVAAYITRCAGEQGKFWEALDLLFNDPALEGEKTDQEGIAEALVDNASQALGLDLEGLQECVNSGRYKSKMESDVQEGVRLKLASTPTFFINGRLVPSPSPQALQAIFDAIIAERGITLQRESTSQLQVGE
jgi:protein-disulfide isomerase/uncharacterized membrane protein